MFFRDPPMIFGRLNMSVDIGWFYLVPISKGYKKEYLVTGETGASLNNAEIKKKKYWYY